MRLRKTALATCLLLSFTSAAYAAPKAQVVGVVLDDQSEQSEMALQVLRKELTALSDQSADFSLPETKVIYCDKTVACIEKAEQKLLDDSEVTALVGLGIIASDLLARRTEISKVAAAPYIFEHPAQTAEQLSIVNWSLDFQRDLDALRRLVPVRKFAFLIDPGTLSYFGKRAETLLKDWAKKANAEIVIVPWQEDTAKLVKSLPKDIDAVYVGPSGMGTSAAIRTLAEELISHKLPSFSFVGSPGVDAGLLVGLATEQDGQRLARRVALNLQDQLSQGKSLNRMSSFIQSEAIKINNTTAQRLGLSIGVDILIDTGGVAGSTPTHSSRLSLSAALKEAMRSNLRLQGLKKNVESNATLISQQRAGLLPQLNFNSGASMIDSDRAFMTNPEYQVYWKGQLSQSIYNTSTWGNYESQEFKQKSIQEQYEIKRLDIGLRTALDYINVLQTRTVEEVRRTDLELSRTNLEIARMRLHAGTAGPEEVYRWEAKIANNRRDLIAAFSQAHNAKVQLSINLNRPANSDIEVADLDITDKGLLTASQTFRNLLSNTAGAQELSDFLTKEGLKRAPELKNVQAEIDSIVTLKDATNRSKWLPSFGAQAWLNQRIWKGGAGTTPPDPSSGIPNPDNTDWSLAVTASLPIFEGGAKYAKANEYTLKESSLNFDKRAVILDTEALVLQYLYSCLSSYPAIELTKDAAIASNNNLEIVTERYTHGSADIIALLDAQNEAVIAKLNAATAVQSFLIDLVKLERTIARAEFFNGLDTTESFLAPLKKFRPAASSERETRKEAGEK